MKNIFFLVPATLFFFVCACKKNQESGDPVDFTTAALYIPVAIAQKETLVTIPEVSILDGEKSFDKTGTPLQAEWKLLSTHEGQCVVFNAHQLKSDVAFSCPGNYVFQLKVYNKNGASYDTATFKVKAPCEPERKQLQAQLVQLPVPLAVHIRAVAAGLDHIVVVDETGTQLHLYNTRDGKVSTLTAPHSFTPEQDLLVAAGNYVYIHGNRRLTEAPYDYIASDTIQVLNLQTRKWSVLRTSLKKPWIKMAANENQIAIAGGFGPSLPESNTIDIYDHRSAGWRKEWLPGASRMIERLFIDDDKIVVAAGASNISFGPFGELVYLPSARVDVLNRKTSTWHSAQLRNSRKSFHLAISGNRIFISGGELWHMKNIATAVMPTSLIVVIDLYKGGTELMCLEQRMTFSAAASISIQDKLLFLGKRDDPDRFELYNTSTSQWYAGKLPAGSITRWQDLYPVAVGGMFTSWEEAASIKWCYKSRCLISIA